VLLDEATHLRHLGKERRFVARQRRQVLQQCGVGAERRAGAKPAPSTPMASNSAAQSSRGTANIHR